MKPKTVAELLLVGTVAVPVAVAQSPGEQAFDGARKWTVQIRGSVSRPFIEDEVGSYSGAGLVVDAKQGWILTNAHVASRSHATLTVGFSEGEPVRARRVYVDPHLDLAVIAYDPRVFAREPPVPELDCEATPPIGHPVGAFGHPWGFRFTGTRGITSAVTYRIGPTMLQTDAPINAGNSGGPLISLETGKVVGVNAAKITDESVEGLSFAVPMPYACTILDLLGSKQDPSPPARLVDFAIDEYDDQTLVVARSRLPADMLDLRVGDEILGVANSDREVVSESDLVDALRGHLSNVRLLVQRGDVTVEIAGSWPSATHITERRGLMIAGALFGEAESLAAGHLGSQYALMVHHVEPGSISEAVAMKHYDLVVDVDGEQIVSLDALHAAAARAARAGHQLQLTLLRFAPEELQQLFVYHHRLLPPADVQWVDNRSGAQSARNGTSRDANFD